MDHMVNIAQGSGLWAILEEGVWTGGGAAAAAGAGEGEKEGVDERWAGLTKSEIETVGEMMQNVVIQRERLAKEVAKYCQERKSGY